MEKEDKRILITQEALKNGAIIAGLSIVISLVLHFIDPVLVFTSWWIGILTTVLYIALLVVVGLNTRKEIGGFWTFGEAFKFFLIIALILSLSAVLYNIVLMKVIDPDLPQKAADAIEAMQRKMMASFGLSEEKVEEALAKAGNMQEKLEISFKNIITTLGVSVAKWGIISLILSAILKKNPPVSFNSFPNEEG
ncbi:DUF4199 domain-containing protein [Pedobacter sp. MW01-1-1]|uniref:DUF4199 domain-containing protein n=1 Tax=Pedobacter sp. MW01-1-1 TaxID=3383027 RepID=UPI003FF0DC1F